MKKYALPGFQERQNANLGLLQRLYNSGVVWLLLYVVFFMVHSNGNYLFRAISTLCFVGMVFLLVLFTNKVLIHSFLKQKNRVVIFVLLSILTLAIWAAASTAIDVCLLHWIAKVPFTEMEFTPVVLVFFLVRLIWLITAYAIVLIFYYQRKENEEKMIADQLKSEKLDMELRYLKSQINPHFLFNALNNIYSMVYTHDDNAADTILKLSEMLRYVLVDCQAETIPLSKEIKYIENYIDFQMMRMSSERDVVLEKDIEKEDFMIAPMLLQPLIENCFKYSRLETHTDGYVHVHVTQKGSQFRFEAENSIANNALPIVNNGAGEKKSGIGLMNVQQRLMLHYGEDYTFDIQQNKESYKVTIVL